MLDNFQLLGNIQLDVFKYLDKYFLSQSQVAEAIGVDKSVMSRFLRELRENEGYTGCINDGVNDLKALSSNGYTGCMIPIENNGNGKRGGSRIDAIPIQVAMLFWVNQTKKGRIKAESLVYACAMEPLETRCNKLFGDEISEDKRNLLLAERATWGDARGYCNSEVKRNLSECFI
ncbi:hypothetical protein [Nostoc linckia]|uniref:hypothetical protein n=1 Tax=Nostoc linckia TaxID=92942 RepID=UPI00117E7109|nr:hypothetical protein [Nostoc linckia]